jgi:hypothetical protein
MVSSRRLAAIVSDPMPERAGTCDESALMLTSPLSHQEPFTRSAKDPTLGWPPSPRLSKSAVKQAHREVEPVQQTCAARKPGRGNPYLLRHRRHLRRPLTGKKVISMQRVFVLDTEKRPLVSCRPARARLLLDQKKAGVYVGRIAIRAIGSCNIKMATGTIQSIHYRYCQPLHRGDGYIYQKGAALPPQA